MPESQSPLASSVPPPHPAGHVPEMQAWAEPDGDGIAGVVRDVHVDGSVTVEPAAVSHVERIVYLLAEMSEEQRQRAREAVEAILWPGGDERPWPNECPGLRTSAGVVLHGDDEPHR